MIRRTPISPRTVPLFPDTTLFRSPGDSPYRAADRSGRATIALPAIQAGRPVPLRLARGTLERAWHDGKFHVALPGGGHYSVALEEQRLEPDGRWTVVGRVQTRLGAQADRKSTRLNSSH